MGVAGGVVGTFVSHPFDTVRTRQLADKRGFLTIFKEVLQIQGWRELYSGIYSPCLSVGLWKGITLGTHHSIMAQLVKLKGVGSKDKLSLHDVACSGCISGAISASICTPFELIKSRAQLEKAAASAKTSNTSIYLKELRQVAKLSQQEGILGVTRGLPLLFARDFPATGVFLGTYECLKRWAIDNFGASQQVAAVFAGTISGPIGWISCYPIEVTRIVYQSDAKWTSYADVVSHLYRSGGVRIFFRGLYGCCLRSIFQIGSTMAVFETLREWW